MKFPVSRESLQAYDYAKEQFEKKEAWIEEKLTLLLKDLCDDFEKEMNSNLCEKKFVWRDIQHKFSMVKNEYGCSICDYTYRFIEKIKETFIGCDVLMDQFKIYITIDWS